VTELVASHTTVMVITYNEAPNIGRCLERLKWAKRVLVIDSGSTDETLTIVKRSDNAEVVHRGFDDFASQCNFGLSQIATPWVLSLDADYELSRTLEYEMGRLEIGDAAAYEATFVYRIYGRPLRGSLYPPRVVLYRRDLARYRNEGHGHRVAINGRITRLTAPIFHDDRKPLDRWLSSQRQYAAAEADYLLASPPQSLRKTDRIRRLDWPAPGLIFLYALIVKRCILDGWPGWFYVLQRLLAETLIALALVERRLRQPSPAASSTDASRDSAKKDEPL